MFDHIIESFAKTDDKKMRKTSVSENMSFQKIFIFKEVLKKISLLVFSKLMTKTIIL